MFESCTVHHNPQTLWSGDFLWWTVQGSNRAALTTPVGRVSNQPSGLLLSPRFPAARNVYQERCRPFGLGIFLWWTVQGSNSNNDDRGLRPKQGGVVGAAF